MVVQLKAVSARAAASGFQPKTVRTSSTILRALFEEIERRNISQMSVAAVTGRTAGSVTHWKAGRATPDIVTVEILANVLGYRLVLERIDV
jgi:ribosome-binding protein aMBF1 (putative translation factor)